jgi:hypothetical protein
MRRFCFNSYAQLQREFPETIAVDIITAGERRQVSHRCEREATAPSATWSPVNETRPESTAVSMPKVAPEMVRLNFPAMLASERPSMVRSMMPSSAAGIGLPEDDVFAVQVDSSGGMLGISGVILQVPRHRAVPTRLIRSSNRIADGNSGKGGGRDATDISETIQDKSAQDGYGPCRAANRSSARQGKAICSLERVGVTDRSIRDWRHKKRGQQQEQSPQEAGPVSRFTERPEEITAALSSLHAEGWTALNDVVYFCGLLTLRGGNRVPPSHLSDSAALRCLKHMGVDIGVQAARRWPPDSAACSHPGVPIRLGR